MAIHCSALFSCVDQSVADGEPGDVRIVAELELAEEIAAMGVDGLDADEQLAGDLVMVAAEGEEAEDLRLAFGEGLLGALEEALPDVAVGEGALDRTAQVALAGVDQPDRPQHLLEMSLPGQHSEGARLESAQRQRGI